MVLENAKALKVFMVVVLAEKFLVKHEDQEIDLVSAGFKCLQSWECQGYEIGEGAVASDKVCQCGSL